MDVMYYVVSFVLPLLLLALFNAKLILAYRQFRIKRRILRPTQLNARFAYRHCLLRQTLTTADFNTELL